ncbi:hypothetical protein N7533_003976 [Penicillium manginii]|uniref:uncharacterized protein n=1 Tax=Penicillium manginii TaxID=203109 RepID=UPI00254987C2|nr:uncharacterized protein N7533_003976 [Penicillium manginii]KAJ5754433.1 hypothetical protein N7533_003976 [Penicillium manginii]
MSPEVLAELLAAPALAAPEGVTPDFENPPNRNGLAWFVTTLCMVISTACGAYWGTAYAGYSLIFTPGYFVHTWNLHNKDLIRPLYVSFESNWCLKPFTSKLIGPGSLFSSMVAAIPRYCR